MSVLILGGDFSNGHLVDAAAVERLVRDCTTIRRAAGNEVRSVWECHTTTSEGEPHTFHLVIDPYSEAAQLVAGQNAINASLQPGP